jgi:hypothetical protein
MSDNVANTLKYLSKDENPRSLPAVFGQGLA